jgi:hypothetical protein
MRSCPAASLSRLLRLCLSLRGGDSSLRQGVAGGAALPPMGKTWGKSAITGRHASRRTGDSAAQLAVLDHAGSRLLTRASVRLRKGLKRGWGSVRAWRRTPAPAARVRPDVGRRTRSRARSRTWFSDLVPAVSLQHFDHDAQPGAPADHALLPTHADQAVDVAPAHRPARLAGRRAQSGRLCGRAPSL